MQLAQHNSAERVVTPFQQRALWMTARSLGSPSRGIARLRLPVFFLAAASIKVQLPRGDGRQKQNNNEAESTQVSKSSLIWEVPHTVNIT